MEEYQCAFRSPSHSGSYRFMYVIFATALTISAVPHVNSLTEDEIAYTNDAEHLSASLKNSKASETHLWEDKHNDNDNSRNSQSANRSSTLSDAHESSALNTFLENVLKAQNELKWIDQVARHINHGDRSRSVPLKYDIDNQTGLRDKRSYGDQSRKMWLPLKNTYINDANYSTPVRAYLDSDTVVNRNTGSIDTVARSIDRSMAEDQYLNDWNMGGNFHVADNPIGIQRAYNYKFLPRDFEPESNARDERGTQLTRIVLKKKYPVSPRMSELRKDESISTDVSLTSLKKTLLQLKKSLTDEEEVSNKNKESANILKMKDHQRHVGGLKNSKGYETEGGPIWWDKPRATNENFDFKKSAIDQDRQAIKEHDNAWQLKWPAYKDDRNEEGPKYIYHNALENSNSRGDPEDSHERIRRSKESFAGEVGLGDLTPDIHPYNNNQHQEGHVIDDVLSPSIIKDSGSIRKMNNREINHKINASKTAENVLKETNHINIPVSNKSDLLSKPSGSINMGGVINAFSNAGSNDTQHENRSEQSTTTERYSVTPKASSEILNIAPSQSVERQSMRNIAKGGDLVGNTTPCSRVYPTTFDPSAMANGIEDVKHSGEQKIEEQEKQRRVIIISEPQGRDRQRTSTKNVEKADSVDKESGMLSLQIAEQKDDNEVPTNFNLVLNIPEAAGDVKESLPNEKKSEEFKTVDVGQTVDSGISKGETVIARTFDVKKELTVEEADVDKILSTNLSVTVDKVQISPPITNDGDRRNYERVGSNKLKFVEGTNRDDIEKERIRQDSLRSDDEYNPEQNSKSDKTPADVRKEILAQHISEGGKEPVRTKADEEWAKNLIRIHDELIEPNDNDDPFQDVYADRGLNTENRQEDSVYTNMLINEAQTNLGLENDNVDENKFKFKKIILVSDKGGEEFSEIQEDSVDDYKTQRRLNDLAQMPREPSEYALDNVAEHAGYNDPITISRKKVTDQLDVNVANKNAEEEAREHWKRGDAIRRKLLWTSERLAEHSDVAADDIDVTGMKDEENSKMLYHENFRGKQSSISQRNAKRGVINRHKNKLRELCVPSRTFPSSYTEPKSLQKSSLDVHNEQATPYHHQALSIGGNQKDIREYQNANTVDIVQNYDDKHEEIAHNEQVRRDKRSLSSEGTDPLKAKVDMLIQRKMNSKDKKGVRYVRRERHPLGTIEYYDYDSEADDPVIRNEEERVDRDNSPVDSSLTSLRANETNTSEQPGEQGEIGKKKNEHAEQEMKEQEKTKTRNKIPKQEFIGDIDRKNTSGKIPKSPFSLRTRITFEETDGPNEEERGMAYQGEDIANSMYRGRLEQAHESKRPLTNARENLQNGNSETIPLDEPLEYILSVHRRLPPEDVDEFLEDAHPIKLFDRNRQRDSSKNYNDKEIGHNDRLCYADEDYQQTGNTESLYEDLKKIYDWVDDGNKDRSRLRGDQRMQYRANGRHTSFDNIGSKYSDSDFTRDEIPAGNSYSKQSDRIQMEGTKRTGTNRMIMESNQTLKNIKSDHSTSRLESERMFHAEDSKADLPSRAFDRVALQPEMDKKMHYANTPMLLPESNLHNASGSNYLDLKLTDDMFKGGVEQSSQLDDKVSQSTLTRTSTESKTTKSPEIQTNKSSDMDRGNKFLIQRRAPKETDSRSPYESQKYIAAVVLQDNDPYVDHKRESNFGSKDLHESFVEPLDWVDDSDNDIIVRLGRGLKAVDDIKVSQIHVETLQSTKSNTDRIEPCNNNIAGTTQNCSSPSRKNLERHRVETLPAIDEKKSMIITYKSNVKDSQERNIDKSSIQQKGAKELQDFRALERVKIARGKNADVKSASEEISQKTFVENADNDRDFPKYVKTSKENSWDQQDRQSSVAKFGNVPNIQSSLYDSIAMPYRTNFATDGTIKQLVNVSASRLKREAAPYSTLYGDRDDDRYERNWSGYNRYSMGERSNNYFDTSDNYGDVESQRDRKIFIPDWRDKSVVDKMTEDDKKTRKNYVKLSRSTGSKEGGKHSRRNSVIDDAIFTNDIQDNDDHMNNDQRKRRYNKHHSSDTNNADDSWRLHEKDTLNNSPLTTYSSGDRYQVDYKAQGRGQRRQSDTQEKGVRHRNVKDEYSGDTESSRKITRYLATDNMEDESQMALALRGELAGKIVENIFQQVQNNEALKVALGPGLYRNHKPEDAAAEDRTYRQVLDQDEIKHTEIMMNKVMELLGQLVFHEVQRKTCESLPLDMRNFLRWMLDVDQEKDTTDEAPSLPIVHQEYTPRYSPDDKFLFDNPNDLETKNDVNVLRKKVRVLENLIDGYNALTPNEKTKVQTVHDYLLRQVDLLLEYVEAKQDGAMESTHYRTGAAGSGSGTILQYQSAAPNDANFSGEGNNSASKNTFSSFDDTPEIFKPNNSMFNIDHRYFPDESSASYRKHRKIRSSNKHQRRHKKRKQKHRKHRTEAYDANQSSEYRKLIRRPEMLRRERANSYERAWNPFDLGYDQARIANSKELLNDVSARNKREFLVDRDDASKNGDSERVYKEFEMGTNVSTNLHPWISYQNDSRVAAESVTEHSNEPASPQESDYPHSTLWSRGAEKFVNGRPLGVEYRTDVLPIKGKNQFDDEVILLAKREAWKRENERQLEEVAFGKDMRNNVKEKVQFDRLTRIDRMKDVNDTSAREKRDDDKQMSEDKSSNLERDNNSNVAVANTPDGTFDADCTKKKRGSNRSRSVGYENRTKIDETLLQTPTQNFSCKQSSESNGAGSETDFPDEDKLKIIEQKNNVYSDQKDDTAIGKISDAQLKSRKTYNNIVRNVQGDTRIKAMFQDDNNRDIDDTRSQAFEKDAPKWHASSNPVVELKNLKYRQYKPTIINITDTNANSINDSMGVVASNKIIQGYGRRGID